MALKWVTAAVRAKFGWPTVRVEFTYLGRRFLVRPETRHHAPSLSVYGKDGLTFNEGRDLINRALSALAWSRGAGADEIFAVGSNMDEPIRVGKGNFRHISDPWHHLYLPKPSSKRALLALAVYREALSLDNTPYKFLGLYKILNIRFKNGPAQMKWINANRAKITDSRAVDRLRQLSAIPDIGTYLYKQGRCAVAHAFTSGAIDPIDPDVSIELRRLEDDIPLMRSFAELLISTELGIPTDSQFWTSLHRVYRLEDYPPEYVQAKRAPKPRRKKAR